MNINQPVNINQALEIPTVTLEAKFGAGVATIDIREKIAQFDMMRNQALIAKMAGKKSTQILTSAMEKVSGGKNVAEAFGPISEALINLAAVRWNLTDDNGPLALTMENFKAFAEKSPESAYDWVFAFIYKLPGMLNKEAILAGPKSGTGALRGANRGRTGKHAKGTKRR